MDKINKLSTFKFIIFMALLGWIFKIATYTLIAAVGYATNNSTLNSLVDDSTLNYTYNLSFIYGALIIAPAWETLLGQWLPMRLLDFLTKNKALKIVLSAVFFGLLHERAAILTGFSIGLILSYSFLLKREKSRIEAFSVTAAIHLLHNAIALIFGLLFFK